MRVVVVSSDDSRLLDSIADGVFDHPVQKGFLEEFLANPMNVLIAAVDNDTVVGMATGIVYVHPDKPRQLFINEVGVDDAYQGRGIGKLLIGAILDEGKRRGAQEAWVATEVGNSPARALYRSTGGVEDPDGIVMYLYSLA